MNAPVEPIAPPALDGACYHCGQPVPPGSRWLAELQGVPRAMCCPGCAAAAQAIAAAGLDAYYDSRTAYAPPGPGAAEDAALDLVDAQHEMAAGDAVFTVEGIRCAACVWLIERRVAALPGVTDVLLNVASQQLRVRWDPAACRPGAILKALRAIGYTAYPYDPGRHGAHLERERKALFRRLFVAGLSMMQVMMYAVPAYLADGAGDLDADMRALLGWASLLLALPAVTYSAWPFLRGAWTDLRRGLPGMDVPVALGIVAAFAGSVVSLVRGSGDVWFDSVTMFVFLLLGSRYLELNARRKASRALEGLRRAAPTVAWRLDGYPASRAVATVDAATLRPGDLVLVPPGQAVPADGVIVEGDTEIDLALLTGESRTRTMGPGGTAPGGAVNVAQAIVLRVSSSARDSTLALLVRLVERAGQSRPKLALWADRVGAWFVAALLVLAAVVFFAWRAVDPARAWPATIAVLVVSCPCALSLATPTALAAALERLLRRGVLAVKPHVLETLERTTHVVFDKTGTLTHGHPVLRCTHVFPAAGGRDARACLRLAAALETDSAHPLAHALRAAAGHEVPTADALRYAVGQGVEGELDGRRYRLGSQAFVAALAGNPPPADAPAGVTAVWLGGAAGWLARFDLADEVRAEAKEIVARLRARGKTVMLLSGDDDEAAQDVARQLGIAHALGGQLPQHKLDVVRALQETGAVVAMVGDGVNDAAVLSGADVSFAMGQGAQLAQLHADCVLLGDGLQPLAEAVDAAGATLRVIRQNLAWAMCYNLAAIPAAALGLLNPWLSGIGMAASSAAVVLNALRLRR